MQSPPEYVFDHTLGVVVRGDGDDCQGGRLRQQPRNRGRRLFGTIGLAENASWAAATTDLKSDSTSAAGGERGCLTGRSSPKRMVEFPIPTSGDDLMPSQARLAPPVECTCAAPWTRLSWLVSSHVVHAGAGEQPTPHNPRKQRKNPVAAEWGDTFREGKWQRERDWSPTFSGEASSASVWHHLTSKP